MTVIKAYLCMCSAHLLGIDYVTDIVLGPKLTQKTQSFVGDMSV